MMDNEKIQEIKDMIIVKDKWYHTIPCIGKKIHQKQNYKQYQKNIHELHKMIIEEVEKEVKKNDFFSQLADAYSVMFDNVEQMTIKNTNIDKYKDICKGVKL